MENKEDRLILTEKEITDLTLQCDDLIDKSNIFIQIFTRAADPTSKSLIEFKSLDANKLTKISENMPEINRATRVFGKQNSQVTNKLMSLQMISMTPYRQLKQCLAKIERKRSALKENIFKLRREKIQIEKLVSERQEYLDKLVDNPTDRELGFRLREIEIDIEEKASNIADTNIYIEAALKEIGIFQETYKEIMESHNIPENWDERDFEEAEIEEAIKSAFHNGLRDVLMTGRLNMGTMEYFYQFGISSMTAYKLINEFLAEHKELEGEGKYPTIDLLYDFLDRMYDLFKDEYKRVMKRTGIKNLITEEYLYIDSSNERESEEIF